jgi:hypothetical protein
MRNRMWHSGIWKLRYIETEVSRIWCRVFSPYGLMSAMKSNCRPFLSKLCSDCNVLTAVVCLVLGDCPYLSFNPHFIFYGLENFAQYTIPLKLEVRNSRTDNPAGPWVHTIHLSTHKPPGPRWANLWPRRILVKTKSPRPVAYRPWRRLIKSGVFAY